MCSPLAPVLAGIFMVQLERALIPELSQRQFWKRYVDDTINFVLIFPFVKGGYDFQKMDCMREDPKKMMK